MSEIRSANPCQNWTQSLSELDCSRWRQCCTAGVQCCERQIQQQRYLGNGTMTSHHDANGSAVAATARCEMTWDGYTCWTDTRAGYRETQACPTYMPHAQPFSKFDLPFCFTHITCAQTDNFLCRFFKFVKIVNLKNTLVA